MRRPRRRARLHRVGDAKGSRWVRFVGCLNFRDLGGYPTATGTTTRWGQVFRSDSLHHLADGDLEVFDALGVEAVYDLRRRGEVDQHPGPRHHIHLELPSRDLALTDPAMLRTASDGERWLREDYFGMLEGGGPVFARLFAGIARADGPIVFHCWSGKDRAGTTATLLLTALGVDRDIVLDDYELTSRCRTGRHTPDVVDFFVGSGISRPAAEALLGTARQAMADALQHLDTVFGGADAYLSAAGLAPDDLHALRHRLTTKPGDSSPGSDDTEEDDRG